MTKDTSNPPGFLPGKVLTTEPVSHAIYKDGASGAVETAGNAEKIQARAMAIATSQMGSTFQTAFMMWMIGSQIQLFTLFMLAAMGTAPLRNLINLSKTFAPVEAPGVNITTAKLVYVLINCVGATLFFWKLKKMGLLPLTSADWVSLLPTRYHDDSGVFSVSV